MLGAVLAGVVTLTSTGPGVVVAGVKTLIFVALTALKHGAVGLIGHGVVVTWVVPNITSVGANPEPWVPKLVPVIIMTVLPASAPLLGETDVTLGKTETYVYTFPEAIGLVPPGVVTVM